MYELGCGIEEDASAKYIWQEVCTFDSPISFCQEKREGSGSFCIRRTEHRKTLLSLFSIRIMVLTECSIHLFVLRDVPVILFRGLVKLHTQSDLIFLLIFKTSKDKEERELCAKYVKVNAFVQRIRIRIASIRVAGKNRDLYETLYSIVIVLRTFFIKVQVYKDFCTCTYTIYHTTNVTI